MASDIISVIIPIYNAEEYLERCLTSICNQTYRNLEIICIDDGSADSSGAMLDVMAEEDGRLRVIHQVNHGESHARNVGLDMATGEWITFVDNDDWLEPDMYDNMLRAALKNEADMVCCSWFKDGDGYSAKVTNKSQVHHGMINRENLLGYIYRRDEYQGFAYMWDKLYRKELFKKVRFDERLRIGGDVLALAEIALQVRRVIYLDESYYHYWQRQDSGCHTNNAEKLLDWVNAYDSVVTEFETHDVPMHIMRYVKRFAAYTASRAAKAAILSHDIQSHAKAAQVMRRYLAEYEETNSLHPEWVQEFHEIMEWRLTDEVEA